MKPLSLFLLFTFLSGVFTSVTYADEKNALSKALTFHASFDSGLDADYSLGAKTITGQKPDHVIVSKETGRFANALQFTQKVIKGPAYEGGKILNYNPESWSTSVSIWLKLNPDVDLEPGYCDPVQIVGDDFKKGFIFLEWSKDDTPRFFRYAVRPLFEIWNPNNLHWEAIPAKDRPMVQVAKAPFSADRWTHIVFTLENANNKTAPKLGQLFLNGEPIGKIKDWDLTFGWNPEKVQLVLGAAYIGQMDDLSVFNRALTFEEVKQLYLLENGASDLY